MIPRRIAGANHWLGAPASWEPDKDGKCGPLAIRTHGDPRHGRGGHGYCESAWEPTPAELEQLNKGGSVILRVLGWQPPVALYVETAVGGEPIEPVVEQPQKILVCPLCEMGIGASLMSFCQNDICPMRGK